MDEELNQQDSVVDRAVAGSYGGFGFRSGNMAVSAGRASPRHRNSPLAPIVPGISDTLQAINLGDLVDRHWGLCCFEDFSRLTLRLRAI